MTEPQVPWAKLAVLSLGAAVGVLALAAALIAVLTPGPVIGLVLALAGLVGAVAAMALVARRVTAGAIERAEHPR